MTCTECGSDNVVYACRSIEHKYKGQLKIIRNIQGFFCDNCGEMELDTDNYKKLNHAKDIFQRRVDSKYKLVVDNSKTIQRQLFIDMLPSR
jgi:YgiT-type zinc finger domain-containing protein